MANLMEIENKFQINGEEIKLTGSIVKNYLTRGNDKVSDQEVVMFINLCKYQKLNPFLNEAYLVKFKGAPAQIITSKGAYMKKAERNPNFDGMKAGIIVERDKEILELEGSFSLKTDTLLGGWAEVYKKDRGFSYKAKINLEEYDKGQSTWNKMPKTMIRKTAIVQALREAFPEDLGALYVEEEQIQPSVQVEVKEEIKEKANIKTIDIKDDAVEYTEDAIDKSENTTIEGPGF
ncbi:phage recombination protein Bet [Clostridium botulinum]|uniref:phage recombination protein Bet n=1 Tax=Clostridium botulinum TaxID=1491 RepID=UPI00069C96AF|nr:phage recombination protein Bet [Clostridium botulinum]KOA94260.1 phage recombination protein Bet [Clostridium botulinum]MCD3204028.1 phage recombination protein Bet [Clostridium botulinum C/D]MCD3222280.1 phage recombination protein Bet [Clostridium botulinum C/D]MCD3232075.1 phage recombination protein Bet [Clostridium botulinum C/D]MCD3273053.1 phage recombination protein Bet [Clostridium botulinum C/D]